MKSHFNTRRLKIVICSLTILLLPLAIRHVMNRPVYNLGSASPVQQYGQDERFSRGDIFPTVQERISNRRNGTASQKANATFYTITRNSELQSIIKTINTVERRFNHNFHYDWIFVSEDKFSRVFIVTVSRLVSGKAIFSHIPPSQWSIPENVDRGKLKEALKISKNRSVVNGRSEIFRQQNRFQAGFFSHLPVLKPYRYFARVEGDLEFQCDLNVDFFQAMQSQNKSYGFVHVAPEPAKTAATLWRTAQRFVADNQDLLDKDNMLDFISDDQGEHYNYCTYTTGLQVGDLDFIRSEAYQKFFDFLDSEAGFFYERWTDGNVFTLATSLLLPRNKVMHITGTGLLDNMNRLSCQRSQVFNPENKCFCNPGHDFSWTRYSCLRNFYAVNQLPLPAGTANIKKGRPRYRRPADRSLLRTMAENADVARSESKHYFEKLLGESVGGNNEELSEYRLLLELQAEDAASNTLNSVERGK